MQVSPQQEKETSNILKKILKQDCISSVYALKGSGEVYLGFTKVTECSSLWAGKKKKKKPGGTLKNVHNNETF